jgi:hypothetical protein
MNGYTGVNATSNKLFTGVNDTGHKYFVGVNETSDKTVLTSLPRSENDK